MDWTDGVEQVAVALQTIPGGDACALCTDELVIFQLTHILADSVGAHLHCSANGLVAGPALIGTPVLKIGNRLVVPKEKFVEWVLRHIQGGAD